MVEKFNCSAQFLVKKNDPLRGIIEDTIEDLRALLETAASFAVFEIQDPDQTVDTNVLIVAGIGVPVENRQIIEARLDELSVLSEGPIGNTIAGSIGKSAADSEVIASPTGEDLRNFFLENMTTVQWAL